MASCRCCGHDPITARAHDRFMTWIFAGIGLAILVAMGVGDLFFAGFGGAVLWLTFPIDWQADAWWKTIARRPHPRGQADV